MGIHPLTLLTALAETERPLTLDRWIAAYMQGGGLRVFAHNRLHLLLGTGMAKVEGDRIVASFLGIAMAHFVRAVRFVVGVE